VRWKLTKAIQHVPARHPLRQRNQDNSGPPRATKPVTSPRSMTGNSGQLTASDVAESALWLSGPGWRCVLGMGQAVGISRSV
jgi:hypothetical protein